jgi:hypothetical protein
VAGIEGFRVQTREGKTVGHVSAESDRAWVVKCGVWPRKRWRALPKEFASIDEDGSSVIMRVSKETLVMSPKVKRGAPVDELAMASWWALE